MPTTFANTIDGNPIYAARSTADKDGNQIDTTYAKSASLATVATSGSYNDLINTPTIPDGVPPVTSSDDGKVLTADYTGGVASYSWENPSGGTTSLFEAVYETTTYADIQTAVQNKQIVYCRIAATGQSRMAFLAYIGPDFYEFQYYRSLSSHNYTNQVDEVYVYTVASTGWTTTTRKTGTRVVAGTNMNYSYSSGKLTLNADAQLPTSTSSDSGKVLTVNSSGNPEWAVSGGGESINAINPIYKNGSDVGLKLLDNDPGLEIVPREHESVSSTSVDEGIGTYFFVMNLSYISLYTSSDARLVALNGFIPAYFDPPSGYYKVILIQGSNTSNIDSSTPYAESVVTWQTGTYLDSVMLEGGTLAFNSYNDFSFNDDFMVFFLDSNYGGDASGVISSEYLLTWGASDAILKWELENVFTDYGLKAKVDQTYNASSINAQSGIAVASAIAASLGDIETALSNL